MSKKENIALLLNVDMFLEERPAMTVFGQDEIQEGIYTAFNLINGECANLPLKVLNYNAPALENPPRPVEPNNEFYRTDFEIDQFRQAIITQTQYTLNMGNDFSQGSSTLSSGGLSATIQRPEKRDILAPGVLKFLQNARLYDLQVYSTGVSVQQPTNGECDLRNIFITYENGDKRFVHQYQPDAKQGNIAVINANNQVSFENPNTISFQGMDADRIKDLDGEYKPIHQIENLAFYGQDGQDATRHNEMIEYVQVQKFYNPNFAYKKGQIVMTYDSSINYIKLWRSNYDNNINHDPINNNTNFYWWTLLENQELNAKRIWDPISETYKLINDFDVEYFGGMSKEDIYNAINASGTVWDPNYIYRINFVVIYVKANNTLAWFKSLQNDNLNHNPEESPEYWEELPTPTIDVNDVINQIRPQLSQEIEQGIKQELDKYKTAITTDYSNSIYSFDSPQAFDQFIANNDNLNADMFEDVPNDYYTKQEMDAKLNDYVSDSEGNELFATKSQFNTLNQTVSNHTSQISNIQSSLNNKPDRQEVYNKSQSDSIFATKSESITKSLLNAFFPVGSVVMTIDGSTHALANAYPSKLREISDSDISYLAIGSADGGTNSASFTIQRNQLPNVNYSYKLSGFWMSGRSVPIPEYLATNNVSATVEYISQGRDLTTTTGRTFPQWFVQWNLNGNVSQQPINFSIKPRATKLRMWKIIATLF